MSVAGTEIKRNHDGTFLGGRDCHVSIFLKKYFSITVGINIILVSGVQNSDYAFIYLTK